MPSRIRHQIPVEVPKLDCLGKVVWKLAMNENKDKPKCSHLILNIPIKKSMNFCNFIAFQILACSYVLLPCLIYRYVGDESTIVHFRWIL